MGVGRAHAKAIVLGEHAVVYGAPAVAVPVPELVVSAMVRPSSRDEGGVTFTVAGSPSWSMTGRDSEGLRQLVEAFVSVTGAGASVPNLDVVIEGRVPHGRGLGSSAAFARAVVLGLADLFDVDISEDVVFELVQTAERVAHGRPSGVDARAVGARGPLWFRGGVVEELTVGCEGVFIVADSGVVGRTKDAVGLLRAGFDREAGALDRFVGCAERLTEDARSALAGGRFDELGKTLTEYHELLRDAGLSTDGIDTLVNAALSAGSAGAKITGGGLGGCAIALAESARAGEVVGRLREAGAVRCWVVPLRGSAADAC
ncbi:mevalonate kinase [Streptomyces sp. NPDC049040]|uniref:mevalonate kinase n=1 Tax=Streptomyces sp. NPDC049040 TaxID=3365593 RepID=UPI0037190A0E